MTIMRPPVTGDVQLDSWMNEVSNSVGTGAQSGGGAASSGLPGSGSTAVNAVTLVLYKRHTAATLPFAQEITVQTLYKYSTTTLTNSSTESTTNFDGWYRAVPDLTQGDYLYAIQVNIADRSDVEIISFDSWSSPTLISSANTAGIDGFNTATVNLFQRTTGSAPTDPQGTLTYTFADSSYSRSVPNDGWTALNNVGTGNTLWVSSAVAASRSGTFVIAATEWDTSTLSTNGTNGAEATDGTNGVSTALLVVYKRSAASPTTPTGGSYNFSSATLTAPSGWGAGIGSGTDPVYVSRAISSVVGQTGTDSVLAWSPAELAFQNGTDGDPGSQGSSFFEGLAFARSATQPSTPTGGSFNFGTNILTPPTGWYVDIPSGTDPAWLIIGNFSIVGQTGVDSNTTWTAPTKAFDNGLDGNPGTDGTSVYLYSVFKRSASGYTQALTGGSYNFSSNSGTPPTGWSNSVPSGTDDLYISSTTASIAGPTGTDSSLTWTIPTTLATNGVNGVDATDGRSTAVLNVYKRSSTVITTAPSGGSFNFSNSNLTPPSTYSSSIPSGTDPVYVSTGLASVVGTTGTDSIIPWAVPALAFQNGTNGVDGSAGKSVFEGYIFKRSSTAITVTPTGGSFNFGTNTLTPPTGWSDVPPSGTDELYISLALFSISGDTGTDSSPSWTAPVLQAKSGTDGSNGQSVFKFSVYRRGPTAPNLPTGGSYNFGTNQITPPTSWYSSAPTTTGDPLWESTTTASVNGTTGVDTSLTWSTVTKLVQDGTAGTDGTDGSNGTDGDNGTDGTNGNDGTDGTDGTNGTDGNPGSTGAAGPRNAVGYLYYGLTATSAPATPSATAYAFNSSSFTSLTANWSRVPPSVSGGDAHYWACSYYVSEATLGGTQTIVFSSTFSSFAFDGLVTFSNLNSELANASSSEITTINGGLLKTGTIDVGQVNIAGTAGASGLNIKSATSGERLEITSSVLKVYDSSNVLRVKLGSLT